MSFPGIDVVQVLFWVFAVATIFLPVRIAVVAYLIVAQFDVGGLNNYSVGTIGAANAVRAIVLPTLLLWRARPFGKVFSTESAPLIKFWGLLVLYATISTLWTSYPLSALKMLGYFYSYTVLFVVFTISWRRSWLNASNVALVICASLLLAVLQTYFLGNQYGNPDFENRFTSFSGAATFAPFLLSLLVLVTFLQKWNVGTLVSAGAALVGLVMTGGRTVFLGLAWVALVGVVAHIKLTQRRLNWKTLVRRGIFGLTAIVTLLILVRSEVPDNRINELVQVMTVNSANLEDVGTFSWRLGVYEKAVEDLRSRSIPRLLLGSGTSSAGSLVLDAGIFGEDVLDPNRSMHDEFLRASYEWGLPGLILLVIVLGSAVRMAWGLAIRLNYREGWAFLAIAGAIFFSLLVENVLSEGSSPGGVGYNLVMAAMVAASNRAAGLVISQGRFASPDSRSFPSGD
jgi:O-antigen ligase